MKTEIERVDGCTLQERRNAASDDELRIMLHEGPDELSARHADCDERCARDPSRAALMVGVLPIAS